MELLLPALRADIDSGDSLFRKALERNADMLIDDIDAPAIAQHIPAWYRQMSVAHTFVLLPLSLDKRKLAYSTATAAWRDRWRSRRNSSAC